MIVREVQAKSILNASKIHEYCVNPYTGCAVGCRYCYAALFIPRYSGHAEPWGTFVDAKTNAPELLARQVKKAKPGTIWIASVCDPYQPAEEQFGLTRACLEILRGAGHPIRIQTKSARIVRDFDLIRLIPEITVTISITTEDERVARLFEPGASPPAERIEALARFHDVGVRTTAFIGPVLPGDHARLVGLLAGKVDEILVDRLNYVPHIRAFAERHGFGAALTDAFFSERRQAIAKALRATGIPHRILF
ncbi:MAG: radical SAM protein [Candidatus Aminicenantes bacterium]|nr:radical SAM protein [Candidatus Aminicenantes bacterium]